MDVKEIDIDIEEGSSGGRLRERAYRMIKHKIISGELKPGTILTETKLADELGMSRTPVRESLMKLSSTGLVKELDSHGIMVAELSLRSILEAYDLQRALEKFAVEEIIDKDLVSSRFNRARFDRMIEAQQACLENYDMWRFFQMNKAMHSEILRLTGNQKILRIMSDLREELFYAGYQSISPRVNMAEAIAEHREIIDAIEVLDRDKAINAVVRHVERAKSRLLS